MNTLPTRYILLPRPCHDYPSWQLSVRAYLTPNKHVRVIQRKKDSGGTLRGPVAPTDAVEKEKWEQSEEHAMGVIMGTAADLHFELKSNPTENRTLTRRRPLSNPHIYGL